VVMFLAWMPALAIAIAPQPRLLPEDGGIKRTGLSGLRLSLLGKIGDVSSDVELFLW
jgi:hypothetical protein